MKFLAILLVVLGAALAGLKADILAQAGLSDSNLEQAYRTQILDVLTPALRKYNPLILRATIAAGMSRNGATIVIVVDDLRLLFDARMREMYVLIMRKVPINGGEQLREGRGPVIWKVGETAINVERLEDGLDADDKARGGPGVQGR